MLHSSGTVDVQTGDRTLCETFAAFFTNKIRSVKAAIASRLTGCEIDALYADGTFTGEQFCDVQPPTVDEVRKLIDLMPAKSSPTNNIPTSIIKSCSDVFSLLIARLASPLFLSMDHFQAAIKRLP